MVDRATGVTEPIGKPSRNASTRSDSVNIQHVERPADDSDEKSRSGFVDVQAVLGGDGKVAKHKDKNDPSNHGFILQSKWFDTQKRWSIKQIDTEIGTK